MSSAMFEGLGSQLFLASWLGMVLAMGWCMVERARTSGLVAGSFARGRLVLHTTVAAAPLQRAPQTTTMTPSCRFRFVAPGVAVFFCEPGLFRASIRTPVTLKGTLRWFEDRIEIEGRLPVASVVFGALWLTGMVVWALTVALAGGDILWLLVAPAALASLWLIGPAWIPFERRRATRAAQEVIDWCRLSG